MRSKRPDGADATEYYVVPSRVVAAHVKEGLSAKGHWYFFMLSDARPYEGRWSVFGQA
jgi:hypothetical protein